jgi:hypothetical protein
LYASVASVMWRNHLKYQQWRRGEAAFKETTATKREGKRENKIKRVHY